jgi:putative cardiolipin synthase
VHIYEIGSKLGRRSTLTGDFGHSIARLHAKVAVIDQRLIFIGSMNMDPRSRLENTEMGLIIDSAAFAQTLSMLFQQRVTEDAFRLRLTPDGEHIEWLETEADGGLKVHRAEPGNTWWPRLQIWLLSPFVDASLL